MATYQVTQAGTAIPLLFFLVQSADHITGLTGATPTVTISKAGGAFASPSGAVSEVGNGWYKVAGNVTDSGTLGPLALHATAASGDPCDELYEVVAINPQLASYGLSLAKTTNITGFNDIAATAIVSSGAITTSGGKVSEVALVDTLTTYTGNTPQTGDSYPRLGLPAGASVSADIAAIKSETDTILNDVNSGAGAIYTRIGAPSGASIAADIASVKTSVGAVTGSVGSVTNPVAIDGTVKLAAARALDSISDTNLTWNDVGHSAIAAAAGKESVSGTTYLVQTPFTGTTLRTFTLDSGSAPTSRS